MEDAAPKASIPANLHSTQRPRQGEFLAELEEGISDPVHKRLLKAYQGDDPTISMELELKTILLEILQRED